MCKGTKLARIVKIWAILYFNPGTARACPGLQPPMLAETSHRIVMMTKTMSHLGIEKMLDHCCMVDCINSSSKRRGEEGLGFLGFLQGTKKRCTR